MQPSSNNSNSYITKLKTMVAAPGIKHARNFGSGVHNRTSVVVQKIPMPVWLGHFAVSFIISTGVTLTVAGVWALSNFMLKSISSITLPKVEVPKIPSINSPVGVKRGKLSIQEVFDRLQQLEIPSVLFTRTVNETFYTAEPDLQGRKLSDKPEDIVLREQWNGIPDELLKKIEQANLSETARRKIGSYSQQDSQRWDQLAKARRLGKYTSFQDLRSDTYQKFEPLFPGQERGKLNQQTFLPIWYAIASDQVGNR
jgi:serine/threonine-protein kinase